MSTPLMTWPSLIPFPIFFFFFFNSNGHTDTLSLIKTKKECGWLFTWQLFGWIEAREGKLRCAAAPPRPSSSCVPLSSNGRTKRWRAPAEGGAASTCGNLQNNNHPLSEAVDLRQKRFLKFFLFFKQQPMAKEEREREREKKTRGDGKSRLLLSAGPATKVSCSINVTRSGSFLPFPLNSSLNFCPFIHLAWPISYDYPPPRPGRLVGRIYSR